jgi:hypothetical protein
MCIIAAIPNHKTISKETLQRCWDNNPHGGGFTYTDGKKVHVMKEMISFKQYWRKFTQKREEFPLSSFICHFRISTHGKINEENCHPFKVNDELSFCHNGVIRNSPLSEDYSDTVMFNVTILKNLPEDFIYNKATKTLIREYIGGGSKLSFLTWNNELHFINEEAGTWDDGIWYSNNGYKSFGYFDRGGVKVTSIDSSELPKNGNSKIVYSTYEKKAVQKTLGFASAAFPPIYEKKKESKIQNINWNERLKGVKTIEADVVGLSTERIYQSYARQCIFCDNYLYTYYEKTNLCCNSCSDKHERDFRL